MAVLGIGEILWDVFPNRRELGGAVTNFAYHVHALGAEGQIVSAVGNDADGDAIRERVAGFGLPTSLLTPDAEHPTGTVTVTTDAAGQPSYVIHENVAWDFIPLSPSLLEAARTASCICFGTLGQRSPVARATIQAALDAAPEKALRVFDVNLRQHFYSADVLQSSLERANVLKINDEELPVVAVLQRLSGTERELLAALAARYELRLVALTKGAKGSVLYTPAEVSDHPGYPAQVVDTVGAGDSFTAALVVGLLRNRPLAALHDTASRLAAYVCTQSGGTPPIPDELKRL